MNNDTKKTENDFSDLEDTKEWNRPGDATPVDVHKDLNAATIARFEEPCKACRGSGTFYSYTGRPVGPCFKCKGKGKIFFKTSPEVRAEQKRRRDQRKADDAAAKNKAGHDWLDANPDVAIHLKEEAGKSNVFANDMLAALNQYGSLTEKQEAAVRNGMSRKAEWAKENKKATDKRDARTADAELDLTGLLNAFAAAVANGLKSPKLHVGNLRITRAKDNSRNPGFLYVNLNCEYYEDRTYFGKINPAGEFFAGRDCTDEIFESVKKLSGDVLAAAQAHGALTGNCSMCNRLLTNEESVQLGIGPICRAKWGL